MSAPRSRDPELVGRLCGLLGFAPRPPPLPAEADWDRLLWLANERFLAGALWTALERRGLAGAVPAATRDYLARLCDANAARNEGLRREIERCLPALNAAGIEPVLLKGGAFLFGVVPDAARDRMMMDVDVLVAPEALARAGEVLDGLGWRTRRDQYERTHETAPRARDGARFSLELHRALGPQRDLLAPGAALERSRRVETASGRLRRLAPEDAVIHSLFHGEIQSFDHWFGSVDLRALYDVGRLAQQHGPEFDWPYVAERFRAAGYERILAASVALLDEAFALAPPAALAPDARARRHARRRLAHALPPPRAKGALRHVNTLGNLLLPRRVVFLFELEGEPRVRRWLGVLAGQARVLARLAAWPWRRWRRA